MRDHHIGFILSTVVVIIILNSISLNSEGSDEAWIRDHYDERNTNFYPGFGPTSLNISYSKEVTEHTPSGQPIVVDDLMFIPRRSGVMYCYNIHNETFKWSTNVDGYIVSIPAVSEDSIFFGTLWGNGTFYALNKDNGTEQWNATIGEVYTSSPAIHNDIIIVGTTNGKAVAMWRNNGSILWERRIGFPQVYTMHSSPAVEGDVVFIGGAALNIHDGSLVWSTTISSSPVIAYDMVFGTTGTHIIALNKTTGSKIWNKWLIDYDDIRSAISPTPCVINYKVYIATQRNLVYCLDAYNGKVIWKRQLGYPTKGSPVATQNGLVYVPSQNGTIHDALNGKIYSSSTFYQPSLTPTLFDDHLILQWNRGYRIYGNNSNTDSDDDGYYDNQDAFPFESSQWNDRDGDWYGDNPEGNRSDYFPDDPTQWFDTDEDGHGDNPLGYQPDCFISDPTQWSDIDDDGYGDNNTGNNPDRFSRDPTQWNDTDGDGFGDNSSGMNADAFPHDLAASVDNDLDGYPDIWNDDMGYNDSTTGLELDEVVGNPSQWKDRDGDGYGDNPYGWKHDSFVNDPAQWNDSDKDGYGDNLVGFNYDVFPHDADEWRDYDKDGIGDNADIDDDNDGIPDQWEEEHGLNPMDRSDAEKDPDRDGMTNLEEYEKGTNPHERDQDYEAIMGAYLLIGISIEIAVVLILITVIITRRIK